MPDPRRHLGAVTLLVKDYDEAIAFYRDAVGLELIEDSPLGDGKRWVLMGSPGSATRLLLAQPGNDRQRTRIGDQTGGRVGLFLHTTDFAADHARMTEAGVTFREAPRHEPYGTVAVFEDLAGNLWDLIEHR